MAYIIRSNYNLICCKSTFGDKGTFRSKSYNPPSSLKTLYSTPISSGKPRRVPPFSIQSHQKNTIVVNGPLNDLDGCNRIKSKSNIDIIGLR